MADYLQYAIKERRPDGSTAVLATITSDDPKRAFLSSLVMVRQAYQRAGVEAPMFDTDPLYFAEPVGDPICQE